jgi:hypothetical protein
LNNKSSSVCAISMTSEIGHRLLASEERKAKGIAEPLKE